MHMIHYTTAWKPKSQNYAFKKLIMKLTTSSFKVYRIKKWLSLGATKHALAQQIWTSDTKIQEPLIAGFLVSIHISNYNFGINCWTKQQPLWIWCANPESIQTYMPINNFLAYSTLITHHLHHQEQESWSTTSLKREKHMLLMDYMDSTLAYHLYIKDSFNVKLQAPKSR